MSHDRALNIIAECLGELPEKVIPSARLVHDLGMDSMDTLEVVMVLESEFDVEIDDRRMEDMATVQDLLTAAGVAQ